MIARYGHRVSGGRYGPGSPGIQAPWIERESSHAGQSDHSSQSDSFEAEFFEPHASPLSSVFSDLIELAAVTPPMTHGKGAAHTTSEEKAVHDEQGAATQEVISDECNSEPGNSEQHCAD